MAVPHDGEYLPRRSPAQEKEISLEDAMEAPAMAPDAEAAVLLQQQQEMVIAALATLSERERVAIVLRDLEGLSTAEVATATGVSEATVRSQISMGRVKIRSYVAARLRRRYSAAPKQAQGGGRVAMGCSRRGRDSSGFHGAVFSSGAIAQGSRECVACSDRSFARSISADSRSLPSES